MRRRGLMVRDGASAPPHHEERTSQPPPRSGVHGGAFGNRHGRHRAGATGAASAAEAGRSGRTLRHRAGCDRGRRPADCLLRSPRPPAPALRRAGISQPAGIVLAFSRLRLPVGEAVPLPPAARKLPYNKGIEALAVVPKGLPLAGTLIAISERGLDRNGNLIGFLIGGPTPGQFSVIRSSNFDVSDAVLLHSGELLVLERKFSWTSGLGIRIRRVALKSLAPGAVVDGPSIFEADLGYEIGNMEGIDAHVTGDGATVLTMVSDDNFSMLQRTLLLQFRLVE